MKNDEPLFSRVIAIRKCEAYRNIPNLNFDTLTNAYAICRMIGDAFVPGCGSYQTVATDVTENCQSFKHNIGFYSSRIGVLFVNVIREISGIFVEWPGFRIVADIIDLVFTIILFLLFAIIYSIQWVIIQVIGIVVFIPHAVQCSFVLITNVELPYPLQLLWLYALYTVIFGMPIYWIIDHRHWFRSHKSEPNRWLSETPPADVQEKKE